LSCQRYIQPVGWISEASSINHLTHDLLEELLDETMKLTHIRIKTCVIVLALEELIGKSRIANLKAFKGKIDLDIDSSALRNRN